MSQAFVTVHSLIRWAVVVIALVGTLYGLYGVITKPAWQPLGDQLSRAFNLLLGINLILGAGLWVRLFVLGGMGAVRGILGGFAILHPLFMFIVLILAGIMTGRRRKAEDDAGRWRAFLIGILVPFILILMAVPSWGFPSSR